MSGSQEIGSCLVSFEMIFEALHSELFRFNFCELSSKIVKIPEFNLNMVKHADFSLKYSISFNQLILLSLNDDASIWTEFILLKRSYTF